MRLGAALLLASPLGDEINGLRRALGDRSLERVPSHLTLVPPVNVRDGDLPKALAVVRAAAAAAPATLSFELGPPATFLPANPVVYLAVTGDLDGLEALRHRLLSPPLARDLSWPFVAHVTLAELPDADGVAAAAAALGAFRLGATIDRVHLLQEVRHDGRHRWVPLADAVFGPPAIIGRGGLALELTRSGMLDPEAAAIVAAARPGVAGPGLAVSGVAVSGVAVSGVAESGVPESGVAGSAPRRLVVTGRREGAAVAVGVAWLGPDGGQVAVIVDPRHRLQGIGSHTLAAVEQSVRTSDWGCSHLIAIGPGGFYAARSHFSLPLSPPAPTTRSGSPSSG